MAHIQWRKEFGADTLDQFIFQERDAIISLYPQGYHKTDKMVKLHLCIDVLKLQTIIAWTSAWTALCHILLTLQLDSTENACDAGQANIHSTSWTGQHQKNI